jgi:hypothetical protein
LLPARRSEDGGRTALVVEENPSPDVDVRAYNLIGRNLNSTLQGNKS